MSQFELIFLWKGYYFWR